jgi:chorismate synthase
MQNTMAGSSFGIIFRLTTFGESHGTAIGGVIDGVPSNVPLNVETIQLELDRRRPGQSSIVTQRKESDTVKFISGIFEGKTTGTPIGFLIENDDQRSNDYDHIKDHFRPSHADFTYEKKYGHRDYRGGGRSSARETASRVVGGAIAKQILNQHNITFRAYVDQVGSIKLTEQEQKSIDYSTLEKNPVRCPHPDKAIEMENLIKEIRKEGDTVGGCIRCEILGVPVGLGEPVFDRLHAELGKAMLSINAAKGFEYGSGFGGVEMRGSKHNDSIKPNLSTETNFSGGIQGGISNGMPIYFRVAFKPVATVVQAQKSINKMGNEVVVVGKGRHDPCVVPRAVPIVEAMAAMVILDFLLRKNAFQ